MKSIVRSIVVAALVIISWAYSIAQVVGVQKVSITVSSLKESIAFYTDVLDFKLVQQSSLSPKTVSTLFDLPGDSIQVRLALLQLGDEQVELMEFDHHGRDIPADSKSNDLWFQHIAIVVDDMDDAYSELEKHHVSHISTSPQTLPKTIPNAAGISAYYFLDPDHHVLELISFPKDKGKAKWHELSKQNNQQDNASPFLGIDHTAIGVEESETGFAFYRDQLGLEIKGHSRNFGTEQEHLNQVFGANVYITGLAAKEGFGVEFLDYVSPPGGRAYPVDSKPNDLWHWHTTLLTEDLSKTISSLDDDVIRISSAITPLTEFISGFMIRDPDGHAILLIGQATAVP
jgi:catechol 2,3-dioxygenase-like lactoylglutathione lyase family enzyme